MNTTGAPDLLSPMYASILYGLIGLGIGLGAAIAGEILGKFVPFEKTEDLALGLLLRSHPLPHFLLRYQLNKVAYAEQGVPLSTMGMILAVLLVIDLFHLWGSVYFQRQGAQSRIARRTLGCTHTGDGWRLDFRKFQRRSSSRCSRKAHPK